MPESRRSLLKAAAAFSASALFAARPARGEPTKADLAETGRADPRLESFDVLMRQTIAEHEAPGAALAVTCDRRLVYARGFGLADREAREPIQPMSLFRVASLSKPITAVAILQLAERGRLTLETSVWRLLELPEPADRRWKEVTLLHLLQHTGGWDRSVSFDPMFRAVQIASEQNVPVPPAQGDIIRFMVGQKLESDPGQRYAYSNFGYCLLGRVIEHVTGAAYEKYVQQQVLAPLGIRRMRLGKTLRGGRATGEVVYYDREERTGEAVVGPIGESVPVPYGAWSLEAMDSHGGWIASAVDLVRFAAAFDDPRTCKLLRPESIATMFAPPVGLAEQPAEQKAEQPTDKKADTKADQKSEQPAQQNADQKTDQPAEQDTKGVYYGCGWLVRSVRPGQLNTWHTGSLDGTSTLLVRRHDGKNWAVLFNTGGRLAPKMDRLIHGAADAVRDWPDHDDFARLL